MQPVTEEEQAEMERREKLEQKQSYCENEAKKNRRIAKHSLDADNKRIYNHRAEVFEQKAEKAGKALANIDTTLEKSENDGIIFNKVRDDVKEAFLDELSKMQSKFGKISTIQGVEPYTDRDSVYGEFSDNSGIISIRGANRKDCLKTLQQKSFEMKRKNHWSSSHPRHVFRHEIGHAIQLEYKINDSDWDNKLKKILNIFLNATPDDVSKYAKEDIYEFISECIAESMTKKCRSTAKDIVNIILGG